MPYFKRKINPVVRAWQWDGSAADIGAILDQLPVPARASIELKTQPLPGLEYLYRNQLQERPIFFPEIVTMLGSQRLYASNWLLLNEKGQLEVLDNHAFKVLYEPTEVPE